MGRRALEDDELADFFGEQAAESLHRYEKSYDCTVRLATRKWRASGGYTDAKLTAVAVSGRNMAPTKLIAKWCPPGPYAREPRMHDEALADSPPIFTRRLVKQPLPSCYVTDGSYVMFQEIAGGSLDDCRPMSELSDPILVNLLEPIVGSLQAEWNGTDFSVENAEVPGLLRAHLRDAVEGTSISDCLAQAGLLDARAHWIKIAEESMPLPNPYRMAFDGSVAARIRMDYLAGRTHGDAHLQNILVRLGTKRRPRREFYLIDLSAYRRRGPLAHDPVNLLLSVVARHYPQLSEMQRQMLLTAVIDPWSEVASNLPVVLRDAGQKVYNATLKFVGRHGWADDWKSQFLLSIQAVALLFTSYENLGPSGRWWFFKLSAHAAAEFLKLHDANEPHSPTIVSNPFGAKYHQ